jgi:hypothetical protein
MEEIVVNLNSLFDMEKLKEAAEIFEDMLPASLGQPIILSTKSPPIVFVAFYTPAIHKIDSGQEIFGPEFRLWHTNSDLKRSGTLAGVIGVSKGVSATIVCALNEQGTTGEMIKPYANLILAMMDHFVDDKAEKI